MQAVAHPGQSIRSTLAAELFKIQSRRQGRADAGRVIDCEANGQDAYSGPSARAAVDPPTRGRAADLPLTSSDGGRGTIPKIDVLPKERVMDLIVVVALFVMCVSYFMRRSLARRRDLRVRSDAASLRKVEAIAAAYRAAR